MPQGGCHKEDALHDALENALKDATRRMPRSQEDAQEPGGWSPCSYDYKLPGQEDTKQKLACLLASKSSCQMKIYFGKIEF